MQIAVASNMENPPSIPQLPPVSIQRNHCPWPQLSSPPPEVIGQENDHYEVEAILQSRQTKNRRGIPVSCQMEGLPKIPTIPGNQLLT